LLALLYAFDAGTAPIPAFAGANSRLLGFGLSDDLLGFVCKVVDGT